MKKSRSTEAVSTYLGVGVSITGTIRFRDTIRLDGKVEGSIIGDSGTVIIGEKAMLHADITADTVIVMGKVDGNIDGKKKIEARPPGRITGDIQAPVVAVEPGVILNGNCRIRAPLSTSEKAADHPGNDIPSRKRKGLRKFQKTFDTKTP